MNAGPSHILRVYTGGWLLSQMQKETFRLQALYNGAVLSHTGLVQERSHPYLHRK